ncbi:MAG: SDR family NAD(P)-dependent oxidoreductase, partial [Pseudomonadota bacterium]
MRLSGKSAIVTGGASGFGEGIARKFVAEGAKVLIADLNLEGAERLAGELGAMAIMANVAEDQSVRAMVETAKTAFGSIDILVNNAGTTHLPAQMEEVTEADFDKVFAVNCKSVYLTAKYLVPLFKAQGSGT